MKDWKRKLPDIIATGLVILTTTLWTFWGIAELYYEGWGLPFPEPFFYLIPGVICLILSLITLTWSRVGGWGLIVVGGAFTIWWLRMLARRAGGLTWSIVLSTFPVSGVIVITGVLFLFEGRYRQWRKKEGIAPSANWFLRNLRYVLALGIPLLTVIAVSAFQLPIALGRYDDGDRGARLIEGNGVRLIWAPAGPGWNWRQPEGWHPSWNINARYGNPPVGLKHDPGYATQEDMDRAGLCRYLSEDGLTLMEKPQNIWRMPTADEIVRSLTKDGKNAGCTWDGEQEQAICRVEPDKETPLWAPDQPPIYYWAGGEYNEEEAWYVSYNGWVGSQPKTFGNPRHGHRCVREP